MTKYLIHLPLLSLGLTELHLNECLTGDLTSLAPLLNSMGRLEILMLFDNPSLRGDLSALLGSRLPYLQQLAIQRTAVHSSTGLQTFQFNRRLKYFDCSNSPRVSGIIPDVKEICNSSTMTILAPTALIGLECYAYDLFSSHGNRHCS